MSCFQILQILPVAPGMVTNVAVDQQKKDDEQPASALSSTGVLVHSYSSSTKTYLVGVKSLQSQSSSKENQDTGATQEPSLSRVSSSEHVAALLQSKSTAATKESQKSHTLIEMSADMLQPAPAAKFYPVLETLMRRGDATAAAARQFWNKQRATQAVVQKTGKALLSSSGPKAMSSDNDAVASAMDQVAPTVEAAKGKLNDWADQAQQAAPQMDQQFRQILTMVKDKEITDLLEDAKTRLEQLVTTDLTAATRDALAQQGIRIQLDLESSDDIIETTSTENNNNAASGEISVAASLRKSREAALASIQRILQQADLDADDLEAARGELTQNFTAAFDALASAAQSDRNLHSLFDNIAEKTTVWQEASGRLLQTRSASLFLEGATRLQARAAAIFLVHQRTGSEIGSKMTKAFTEGDAALARIKSIQLGDALKDRLVRAIEVRSDSLGGLDAIIASALTSVRNQDADTDQIKSMLTMLQSNASTATTDARETLLSVLSRHNTYRDVALTKLESVLCDLESQFGSELSPEDIATLVRGEGGTAKLFEPIARRAWQQIEKQLDEAESQISDENVLQGLSRVRKIMSGELTLSALTDEIVNVLNDENVVAAGEVFVQRGEEVLDALEGVSSNKVVNDALKIAEKAGITKDSVMREIQKLDVDQLLDTAGGAVTDESKRRKLVSNAIDTALDFILRILPSMPVPPFEGVRDGLLYNISNLSMAGFKVKKEDIMIELAGMRALKRSSSSASSTSNKGDEISNETSNADFSFAVDSNDTMEIEEIKQEVNAAELLIIDVRRVSAVLDDTEWSFEQTYMPYLKGQGKADVRLSDGAIRLQFELRKRRKAMQEGVSDAGNNKTSWEPVLCLHDRNCSIDEVELKMQGDGRITWLVNKAASIFKNRELRNRADRFASVVVI